MPDEFVPFFSQMPNGDSGGAANGKNSFVAAGVPAAAAAQSEGGDPAARHRPVVKLQREGDRVRAIRIECSCGQVIELDCVY